MSYLLHLLNTHNCFQGTYFSDSSNNDASLIKNDLRQNISALADWIHPGAIFVVDRGYRDAIPQVTFYLLDYFE